MDPNRKRWNEGHQKLNRALASGDRERAIELFLAQHAMVHSARMAKAGLWSYEDEVLGGLNDAQVRQVVGEHSIVWILLHLARIEDITMNMLVAGTAQIFTKGGWAEKMKVEIAHSANRLSAAQVSGLSAGIEVKALRAYRVAVGRRTRQIVQRLEAADLKQKVRPERIQNVLEQGAVMPEAMEILEYWGNKTIGGLLLMPATRHCILHLNEAERLRKGLFK